MAIFAVGTAAGFAIGGATSNPTAFVVGGIMLTMLVATGTVIWAKGRP